MTTNTNNRNLCRGQEYKINNTNELESTGTCSYCECIARLTFCNKCRVTGCYVCMYEENDKRYCFICYCKLEVK